MRAKTKINDNQNKETGNTTGKAKRKKKTERKTIKMKNEQQRGRTKR